MKPALVILMLSLQSAAFAQHVVYPLQVGTRWFFQAPPLADYQPSAPKEVLKDTVMENGKTYAAVLSDQGSSIQYQRAENDSVFFYNLFTKQEELFFRFNAAEKETVVTRKRTFDTTDIILTDTTTWTLFGKPVKVYTFLIDVRRMIDDEQVITIADGFGVVKVLMSFGYYTSLSGAIIDGVTYGRIQAFAQRYYPLTVGNQWFYDSSAHPYTIKVVSDTLLPNNQHYGVLSRDDFAHGRYVRADSHFVYYYDPAQQKEVSVFNLEGKRGDTTTFHFDGFEHSVIMAIDTVFMFGERTRLIHYRLDGIIQRDVTLSDKFGPVGAGYYGDPPAPWPDVTQNAVGCIIDGWRYGLVTSVRPGQETVPDEFVLSQNYPNPFNPSTTIRFSLTKPSTVRLEIFDALGRLVVTLASERLSAGSHTRQWNAAQCASGVYYCRLTAGSRSDSKKMLLLR